MQKNMCTENPIPYISIFSGIVANYTDYDILGQLNTVLLIQQRYSYRISEVLNLDITSLADDFNIQVKLSKCEEYSIIRDEEIYNKLQIIFSHTPKKTFTITYKNYYYFLNKYHNGLVIKSKTHNNKVTHSFRYRKAEKIKQQSNNKKIIKASLHHQSVKSQDYYLNSKKESK
jgi:hypothetical protein